ncbi:putative transposase/invertase (TIGR01784 family) [Pedobacter sp. AK017]|uniref:Rpn family recombination-promoting nuclease/putative transposase n=1 Tax=Pedobacter sp. AK017 TaxID=2723073 RepID=UPI00161DAFEC|nr:Rpn family recombination-promoting nuclease/putative transposase [Pedobacter sp. AK017]MBB5438486.1 putative transposase/invertase (TIGR01784 family) [Pedobacter sp. AK017]
MRREDATEDLLAEPVVVYSKGQDGTPYFIDPLEDLGFKRLFSAEQNKDITITFLNHVLKGKREVVSLEFLKNEYPGETQEEGGVIIDIVCKDQIGAFFLVEMQKSWHQNFKERSLFYASRLITEQAPHGNRKEWAYSLKDVYVIALLEKFTINAGNKGKWLHDIALVNTDTGKVFNERLRFTYIELLSFKKTENQLETDLEKWIYALKNLKHLKQAPAAFTEPQLLQFCQAARYINLTKEEKNMISAKTKARWDYYYAIDGAKIMGREEGETRGAHQKAAQIAIKLKNKGVPFTEIQELTELSITEIKNL